MSQSHLSTPRAPTLSVLPRLPLLCRVEWRSDLPCQGMILVEEDGGTSLERSLVFRFPVSWFTLIRSNSSFQSTWSKGRLRPLTGHSFKKTWRCEVDGLYREPDLRLEEPSGFPEKRPVRL